MASDVSEQELQSRRYRALGILMDLPGHVNNTLNSVKNSEINPVALRKFEIRCSKFIRALRTGSVSVEKKLEDMEEDKA